MSKDADMYSRALGQFINSDAQEMAQLEQLVDQTIPCHPSRLRQTLCLPQQPGERGGAPPFASLGFVLRTSTKRKSKSEQSLLQVKGGINTQDAGHEDSWVQRTSSDSYFESRVVQALTADQLYSAGMFTIFCFVGFPGTTMSKDADMYSRALGQFINSDAQEMAQLEQLVDQTIPCHPSRLRQTLCLPQQPGERGGAPPFASLGFVLRTSTKRKSKSEQSLLQVKGGINTQDAGHEDSWVQRTSSDSYFESRVVQALTADQLYSAGLTLFVPEVRYLDH
eukprot:CAMPEP_0184327578 /NCGR_PEP_ID=MMETSP1049-20130417/143167_1 /TAXON_ID=77928 /ORGANISM="Proteomonas sulcata, Strain CCMP704" /LENGTH=279 /DNA_ID=CAMNT_0026649839 /DNA_START=479 /DNA_END=1319 /DNA_ORIENTATION=-